MRRASRVLAVVAAAAVIAMPTLASELYEFDTSAQQKRFQQLTNELRCLVCQGQSIADSNADLALDLREKVHEMILAGASDAEIRDFMTDRYGDFVLYRPPFQYSTVVLWLAPIALGVVAVAVALVAAARRRRGNAPRPLSPAERERLRQVGMDEDEGPR